MMNLKWIISALHFLVLLPSGRCTDYNTLYELLSANIDAGKLDKNIEIIESETFKSALSKLGCKESGKLNHLAGLTYYYGYRENIAVKYFIQAGYHDWKDCEDVKKSDLANTIYNIGVAYQYSENIFEGKKYIDSALALIETINDHPKDDLALKYAGAGQYHIETHNYHVATDYYRRFENLTDHVDVESLVAARVDQLTLHRDYGKLLKAYDVYLNTDSLFQANSNSIGSELRAIYNMNIAALNLRMNKFHDCEIFVEKAMQDTAGLHPSYIASILEIKGNILKKRKNLSRSEEYYQKALKKIQSINPEELTLNTSTSPIYYQLANIYYQEKKYSKALEYIDLALREGFNIDYQCPNTFSEVINNSRIRNPYNLIEIFKLKEKIVLANGDYDALERSLVISEKIDTILHKTIEYVGLEKSQLELLPVLQTHTDEAMKTCFLLYERSKDSYYLEKAYYFSTQAKYYLLKQRIQQNRLLHNKADRKTLEKISLLRSEISRTENLIINTDKDSLRDTLLELELELNNVLSRFLSETESESTERSTSLTKLQKALDSDMVVLDLYEGDNEVFLLWITNKTVIHNTISTERILPLIDSLETYNTSPSLKYNTAFGKKLYQEIFSTEIRNSLPSNYRLKIIPEGKFFELNFETLVDENGDFLLKKHAISYAYHPKFLISSHKKKKESHFIGFGTQYTNDLNQQLIRKNYLAPEQSIGVLHHAELEIEICNEFMKGKSFLGREASLSNFKKHAPGHDIIYLSLHGLVDTEDGDKTGIIFDNRSGGFVMDDHDLNELRLQSDLVIMSSCHSASGKRFKGEGLKGMTRSFFASGARNVLSSIWTAGERASLEILPTFLKNYKDGLPSDISLRNSKITYLNNSPPLLRHPFYWGNFVIYGDLNSEKNTGYWYYFVAGILFLGLFLTGKRFLQ